MAAFSSIIGAIAVGTAVAGTAMQISAAKKASKAQSNISRQERRAEGVRKQQMELDSSRRRREMVRQAQMARAVSQTRATAQGASGPGSSVLPGAYGGISGRTGVNMLGVSQNEELGAQMFRINANISRYQSDLAGAQSQASMGAGLTSLGGVLLNNMGTISRIGAGIAPVPTGLIQGPVAYANSAFGNYGIY